MSAERRSSEFHLPAKLSRGARRGVNRELAGARRSGSDTQIRRAEEKAKGLRLESIRAGQLKRDIDRVQEIEKSLRDPDLSDKSRESLKLEQFWFKIKFSSGIEDRKIQLQEMGEYMARLEENKPDVMSWLESPERDETGKEVSRAISIRDKVIPPHELKLLLAS